MSSDEVDRVIYEAYGKKKEEIFAYFDEEAHGSASISQVHRARLMSGEDVAVKIQRIGARDEMEKDIVFIRRLVKRIPFLKNNPYIDMNGVIDELEDITHLELDFAHEARNLQRFRELNRDIKYVSCPLVYSDYSRPTVIVMEYIDGIKISDKETLIKEGYDIEEIGKKYIASYLKQVLEDGFFQADPHTGNLKIRDGQIVWYDLGMMGEFTDRDKKDFMNAIESAVTGDSMKCLEALTSMCSFRNEYDKEELFKDVDDYITSISNKGLENWDMNMEMQRYLRIAKKHGASINPAYTIVSRGIATLQGTLEEVFPEVNFFDEMKEYAIDLRLSELRGGKKDKDIEMLKMQLKLSKILSVPENIATMIEQYSKGMAPIKLEMGMTEKSQIFVSRIVGLVVGGLIIVALLVSSSIIVLSKIEPLVWGIPVIGLAGYTLAVVMIVIIFIQEILRK